MRVQVQHPVEHGGNFQPVIFTREIAWADPVPPDAILHDGEVFKFVSWRDGVPTFSRVGRVAYMRDD